MYSFNVAVVVGVCLEDANQLNTQNIQLPGSTLVTSWMHFSATLSKDQSE